MHIYLSAYACFKRFVLNRFRCAYESNLLTECLPFLVSNEVPEVPVVSPSSGAVFEKRIIEKYIIENGVDPISGKDLRVEDLIEIKSKL